jgi:hypothetical protein
LYKHYFFAGAGAGAGVAGAFSGAGAGAAGAGAGFFSSAFWQAINENVNSKVIARINTNSFFIFVTSFFYP